jgi:hypothetical protein
VETCWYCERRAASHDTALRATVYGNVKDPPPAGGRNVDRSGDIARVTVPIARCTTCADLQRRESAITLSGLGLACGALVAARVNRGMPRRDARNHPDVVALTGAGWSYDPPGGD